MATMTGFISLLDKVCLGGIINECVVTIENNKINCKAMDLTSAVYVEVSEPLAASDDTIAFGNISLLTKYLKSYQSVDIDMIREDNRLVLKPKGGATLKYLLSQPDLIPTYDEEWGDESRAKAVLGEFESELVLTNEAVSEFINLMKMFSPESVFLHVAKKGTVTISGGNETEHQFNVTLGRSALEQCDVQITSKNLLAVLSVLDYTENPSMMIGPDKPIVINSGDTTWVLNPVSNE